ncbi:MAG: hypothetical protein AAGD14_09755 [Planctomycetota bacterium]
MRTLLTISLTMLIALWCWFAFAVAPVPARGAAPQPVMVLDGEQERVTAEALHNEGVALNRAGRPGDALLYFERAVSFRPLNETYRASAQWQRARLERRAWLRFLVPASALTLLLGFVASVRGAFRRHRERRALRGLRGDGWTRIGRGDDEAELNVRFNEEVEPLLARHPLTVVWSSARHGKHMKSRPPVETMGRKAVIRLEGERLERLQRYPGEWKGFLYLDGHEVGEAVARVG